MHTGTRRPANMMTHRAHRPERGNTMKIIETTNTTTAAAGTETRNTTTKQDGKIRRDALLSSIRYSLDRLTCEELERVEAYITRLW